MILNGQRKVRIARRPLDKFLEEVERELGVKAEELTVRLVCDEEIARMNRSFRGKKGPTDVLSFPAGERKWRVGSSEWREGLVRRKPRAGKTGKTARSAGAGAGDYLGDIAIAPETARRYAKRNGRKFEDELRVLILHGVLHLLGYDHETDHGRMNRVERKLRRRFGLA